MNAEFKLEVYDPGFEESKYLWFYRIKATITRNYIWVGKQDLILEGPVRNFPENASLTQYFQAGIAKGRINGDHIAIIDEDHSYTFHGLDLLSTKLARTIRTELAEISTTNPDGDTVIGLCLPPSKEFVLSVFAILKLGAAYLPLDLRFPTERLQRIVENCRPVFIITERNEPSLRKLNSVLKLTRVLDIDTLLMKVNEDKSTDGSWNLLKPFHGPALMAERVAIVIYTSGSTGEPKGVRLTHRFGVLP